MHQTDIYQAMAYEYVGICDQISINHTSPFPPTQVENLLTKIVTRRLERVSLTVLVEFHLRSF